MKRPDKIGLMIAIIFIALLVIAAVAISMIPGGPQMNWWMP